MAVTNIISPLAASEAFMLRDLARSGLTPDDWPVPTQPLVPQADGVSRFRIHYPFTDYWQDRYDRDERKYLGPKGVPTELFWTQPLERFVNATLTASVEGAKKALLFHITTGIPAVGLHSCNGWKEDGSDDELDSGPDRQLRVQLRAALASSKVHGVLIDGDWKTNPNVGAALGTYQMELECLGIQVLLLDLSGYGGYDDWFVKTYGADRAAWPSPAEVTKAILKLPRIDAGKLPVSRNYMLGTQDRFNRGLVDFTDRGRATQWLRLMGPKNVRFLTDSKQWAFWSVGRWNLQSGVPLEDVNSLTLYYARKSTEIAAAAAALPEGDKRVALDEEAAEYSKQAQRSSSNASRKAVLDDVASRAAQKATLASFDADPDVLAVVDGKVITLRDGGVRDERQDDLILNRAAAGYTGEEPAGDGAEQARRFVREITSVAHGVPNPEKERWMQARLGAALRGKCTLGSLEIWIGRGANGKSVLADLVQSVLGDYAVTLPAATLMSQLDGRSAEAASPFMIRAVNKRAIFTSESKDTDYLDVPKVKLLTGVNDKIAMRANYGDAAEYRVTFTIFLLTNSLPNVAQNGEAVWDRLAPLSFDLRWKRPGVDDASLPEADTRLSERLVKDSTARDWLLWWMVSGGVAYEREGLPTKPASVKALTTDYRGEQDVIGHWMGSSGYELDPDGQVEAKVAYASFKERQLAEGARNAWNQRLFGHRLRERFPDITRHESNGKSFYKGIKSTAKYPAAHASGG